MKIIVYALVLLSILPYNLTIKTINVNDFKAKKQFKITDLKERLVPAQFQATQHAITEFKGSGFYNEHQATLGTYNCIVCKVPLFEVGNKYKSDSGWPAFHTASDNVIKISDPDIDPPRNEVRCVNCGAHLGYEKNDGPEEFGGLRYVINSACLIHKIK